MKAAELTPTFCRNLKAIREARGISLRTLATRIDSTAAFICSLENGKTSPTLHMIERLAEGLDVETEVLLTQEGAKIFLSASA